MDNTTKIKLAELREKLNMLLWNLSVSKAKLLEELDILNNKEISQGQLNEEDSQRKIELIDKIEKTSKEEATLQKEIYQIEKAEADIDRKERGENIENALNSANNNQEDKSIGEGEKNQAEGQKIVVDNTFLQNLEDKLTSVEIFLWKKKEEQRWKKDFWVDTNVKNVIVDEKVTLNELWVSEKILKEASEKIKKINRIADNLEIREGKISNWNLKEVLANIEEEYKDIIKKDTSWLLQDKILWELKRKKEIEFEEFVKSINTFTDGLIQIEKGRLLNGKWEILIPNGDIKERIWSLAFSEAEKEVKKTYEEAKDFLKNGVINEKTKEVIDDYNKYLNKLKDNAQNNWDEILQERTKKVTEILEKDIVKIREELEKKSEEVKEELEKNWFVEDRKIKEIQEAQIRLKWIWKVLENIGRNKYVGQQGIEDVELEIDTLRKEKDSHFSVYNTKKAELEKQKEKFDEIVWRIGFYKTWDTLFWNRIYREKKSQLDEIEKEYNEYKQGLDNLTQKLNWVKAKKIKLESQMQMYWSREVQEGLIDKITQEEQKAIKEKEALESNLNNLRGKEKEEALKKIENLDIRLSNYKKNKELIFKNMSLTDEEKQAEIKKIKAKGFSIGKEYQELNEKITEYKKEWEDKEKKYKLMKEEVDTIEGVINWTLEVSSLEKFAKEPLTKLEEERKYLEGKLKADREALDTKLKAIDEADLSIKEKTTLKKIIAKTGWSPKFKELVDEKLLEKIEKDRDLAVTLDNNKMAEITAWIRLSWNAAFTKWEAITWEVHEKTGYVDKLYNIKKGSNKMSHIDNKYWISNGMDNVLWGYFTFFKDEYQHIDTNFERKYQDYNNIDKTNALYLTFYDKVINNIVDKSENKWEGDLNAKVYFKWLMWNKENITSLKRLFGSIHIKYFTKVSKYNSSKLTEKLWGSKVSWLLVKFQDAIIKADSIILDNEEQGGKNLNPYITWYSDNNPWLEYLENLKGDMKELGDDKFVQNLFAFWIAFKDLEYKTAALLEIIKEGVPIDANQRDLLIKPNKTFHNLLKEIWKEDLLSPLDNTLISSLVWKWMFSDLWDINDGLRVKAKWIEAFRNYNSISGKNKEIFKDLAEHWADASWDEGLRSHFRHKDTIESIIKEEVNGRLVDRSWAIWYRIKLFMEYSVYPMLSYILYSLNLALRLNIEKIKLIHFNLFLFIAFVVLNIIWYVTIPWYAFLIDNIFITKNSMTTLLYDFNVFPWSNPLLSLLFLVFLIFILFTSGALILVVLFDKVWMLISQALNKDEEAMDRLKEIIKMSFLLFVMIVFLNILHIL